jgi:hypothetical protein
MGRAASRSFDALVNDLLSDFRFASGENAGHSGSPPACTGNGATAFSSRSLISSHTLRGTFKDRGFFAKYLFQWILQRII